MLHCNSCVLESGGPSSYSMYHFLQNHRIGRKSHLLENFGISNHIQKMLDAASRIMISMLHKSTLLVLGESPWGLFFLENLRGSLLVNHVNSIANYANKKEPVFAGYNCTTSGFVRRRTQANWYLVGKSRAMCKRPGPLVFAHEYRGSSAKSHVPIVARRKVSLVEPSLKSSESTSPPISACR